MTSSARIAMALWAVLALAVFSVTFDWKTRIAGHDFVRSQAQRRAQGAPLDTIENGFRPMVRTAALQSSGWPLLILGGGAAAVRFAARRRTDTF
jgi:NAD/NADP transhydrogenase alpha subunit